MVEIEQEELERLKGIENAHNALVQEHENLKAQHNTLKDDYIAMSKGQHGKANNDTDLFDDFCSKKFGK